MIRHLVSYRIICREAKRKSTVEGIWRRRHAAQMIDHIPNQSKSLPTPKPTFFEHINSPQPSQKTFIVKQKLAKKSRQNRPVPQWFRLKTDSESQIIHCAYSILIFRQDPVQR